VTEAAARHARMPKAAKGIGRKGNEIETGMCLLHAYKQTAFRSKYRKENTWREI